MVSEARLSAVLSRSPTPTSDFPSDTEKIPAGYSTRVPKSGTTYSFQSVLEGAGRTWAGAPSAMQHAMIIRRGRNCVALCMSHPGVYSVKSNPHDSVPRQERRFRCPSGQSKSGTAVVAYWRDLCGLPAWGGTHLW